MELHPKFRLNGTAYSTKNLLTVAQTWSKEADAEQKKLGAFLLDWLSDIPTIQVQTSGSTGTPKTMEMPKAAMRASAERTAAFFSLSPGDTALLCLPLDYIAGKMMLVRAMVLGLSLDMIPPKTKLSLGTKTYDFGALIPLQAQHNLEQLHQIKTLLIGGAPINTSLRKELATIHNNCVETYGMTETLTHVATRPVTYPATSFKVMPDVRCDVDDENCLTLMVPYISNDIMRTNDVVELIDKTSFRLLGRRDFVINSGGKKIYPEQLEETLAEVLDGPFFFCGFPDETLGEKLVLLVEADTTEKARIQQLVTKVFEADKHHIPKAVFCLETFVYTPSGKLDRKGTKAVVKGS